MNDFIITAKNNPKIKELKLLMTAVRRRNQQGLFVVEGVRLCREVLNSGYEIENTFITEECALKNPDDAKSLKQASKGIYTVSAEVMKHVSDTVTPQGVVCTVKMKDTAWSLESGKKYIALETVQNPDNLGAIARTAEALGIDGMAVVGGCDIYNPKAMRASMGALFRLKIGTCNSMTEVIEVCHRKGLSAFAAVPDSSAADITGIDFSKGGLCIIGNEGNGVSQETVDICDKCVTIKMRGRAESLNAAAAASIIMWEMVK